MTGEVTGEVEGGLFHELLHRVNRSSRASGNL